MATPGTTDAVITVRLNTAGAQRDLAALGNALGGTGGGMAAGGGGGGGFGMGQLASTAGQMAMGGRSPMGMMAGIMGGPTNTAIGAAVSEFWMPKAQKLQNFLVGGMGAGAQAAQSARERTIQAFGMLAGATGQMPAGAREFFDAMKNIERMRTEGRRTFEQNDYFYGGKEGGGVLKDGFQKMFESMDALINKLDNFTSGVKVQ